MNMKKYLLIIIGLVVGLTVSISQVINVTAVGEPTADFGDAPDASNRLGDNMTAYPRVTAAFPTALQMGTPPYGPSHENSPAVFILGTAYSAEASAEDGADDDIDGQNNIQPISDLADRDGFDDGLTAPETFEHCLPVTLSYEVTVLSTYTGPVYANLWADWNHDGTWGGGPTANCPGATTTPEWVLQNKPLSLSAPDTYVFTVVFTPWYPDSHASTWLRLSVSEQMANSDGSSPAVGYQLGETEDYLIPGTPISVYLPLAVGGNNNPPPPPPDPNTHIDPDIPPLVIANWPQLPEGTGRAVILEDGLTLRLQNDGDFSGSAMIDVTLTQNGTRSRATTGPVLIHPAPWATSITVDLPQGMSVRSPGSILAEVHVTPDSPIGGEPGRIQPFDTPAREFFFHEHSGQAGRLVIYNEEGYRAQIEARAFDDNSGLWERMSAGFPGPIPEGLARVVSYEHGDPLLMEGDPEEGLPGLPNSDRLDPANKPGGATFTLCLEWFTAPVDNGFGEDYFLQDAGWYARGAHVRVYVGGSLTFNDYLNQYGCAYIPMNGASNGSLAHIEFDGYARLVSGSGYNYLHRFWGWIPPAAPSHWTTAIDINGIQSGSVYRPEAPGNDAFSILSWAMQERFNGGISGETIVLVRANCGLGSSGSCSITYSGYDTIFIQSSQWNRKYVVGHEYGHKILAFAANYTNDCTYGTDSHGIGTTEYTSCAAMEGWAHYVAVDIFNSHWHWTSSINPGAVFVYWNGVVYDVEKQLNQCYINLSPDSLCDTFGIEKDWMRFW
jgi:hypothetical protein